MAKSPLLRRWAKTLLLSMPRNVRILLKFYLELGYPPRLRPPQSFNEKITKRKLLPPHPAYTVLSDKLQVRDYVATAIGAEYLVELIGVYDDPDPAIFTALERDAVAKTTHASGDAQLFFAGDTDSVRWKCEQLRKSLRCDYGRESDETWYSNVKRQVIVETMLRDEGGSLPLDYKFHVFRKNGHQRLILQVDYDRFDRHNRTLYDQSLEILPFSLKYPNVFRTIEPPENINEMFDISMRLAGELDYVRVDLYNVSGRIYFGELTLGHGSGLERFTPRKFDHLVGALWEFDARAPSIGSKRLSSNTNAVVPT